MRRTQFANGEYYHIYNRGVDKRDIFLHDDDFWRFYFCMFLFNDDDFVWSEIVPKLRRSLGTISEIKRKPLVDILSFSLMPNHYHFYVKQLIEDGISLFMQRLNQGYTRYFNIKNERTGALFEGTFKAVHVNKEGQFLHMPRYIHLNIADLIESEWREKGVKNWARVLEFMEKYKWSSHNAFLGKPQKLDVVNPEVFKEIFKTPEQYLKFLKSWAVKDWGAIKDFVLE